MEKTVGNQQAEAPKHDHAEAEATMKGRERMEPEEAKFDTEVQTLIRESRHRVQEEEGRMITELRAAFSHDELVEMAQKVESVKRIAPTRAHPMTPNEAGVRTALGPVASLLDHLRDAVSGRGKSSD